MSADQDLLNAIIASGNKRPGMLANGGFVMGRINSFSPVDGSNTVSVMGATLTNVPMLLTGAEIDYQVGDPVILIVIGNSYSIMGKVATVGSPQFASASTSSISTANATSGLVSAQPM